MTGCNDDVFHDCCALDMDEPTIGEGLVQDAYLGQNLKSRTRSHLA